MGISSVVLHIWEKLKTLQYKMIVSEGVEQSEGLFPCSAWLEAGPAVNSDSQETRCLQYTSYKRNNKLFKFPNGHSYMEQTLFIEPQIYCFIYKPKLIVSLNIELLRKVTSVYIKNINYTVYYF